jgi:hypothetical protein
LSQGGNEERKRSARPVRLWQWLPCDLLWQGADTRAGNRTLRVGTFISWDDDDHGFQAWADEFGKRLSDWGACSSGKTPLSE